MTPATASVIAQLLFVERPGIGFPGFITGLHRALLRGRAKRPVLQWDCDDVAMIDLEGARILLGLGGCPSPDHAACLTVSVGPISNGATGSPLLRRAGPFCRTIVECVETRWPADLVLWQRLDGAMTPERRDEMVERLTDLSPCSATAGRAAALARLRAALRQAGAPLCEAAGPP
ncbi:hypothetical protein [Rhodobacter sp. CZR27]|uniref:hypothetical protein n=1 Tax=Rhodobacter sp. CZR27 TaxID=2033869 RepID=UPI000BBEA329|nr:hypothetical protein [Rhodobacter sp. CZR27]